MKKKLTYYTTAAVKLLFNAIIAAKNEISCSFVPVFCYLRLARASSKITAASRRMSSSFVMSTTCFLYDKDSRIESSRRATESLLRAGILILFWAENPRSHSIVCYIRIIDVEAQPHSTAIARPRTIRIIETTYSPVLRAFEPCVILGQRKPL